MKVTNADFIISAASQKQYPTDQLSEIALAGRSNVGKSSFINKMIQRKDLARTSSKPGKTQTLNFYKINDAFYFVDVPGYGYAKVSKKDRDQWGVMMEEYFQLRKTLKVVMLIVDIRHDPTKNDVQMFHYLQHFGISIVVVATKLDKVPKNKRSSHIRRARQVLNLQFEDDLIPFSSETGEGKDKIWSILKGFI